MRLIDADVLKQELYQQWFMDILLTQTSSEDMFYALAQKIDEIQTAYDPDEVVEQKSECEWKLEDSESNLYVTECENRQLIFEGTPKENGYKYCPYCGRKIKRGGTDGN